jgi:hypothetical protein
MTVVRVLGRALGLERAIVREGSARLSFREGVVPKMSVLDGPLRQRQAFMDVRRVHPLSVELGREGLEPILETVMVALSALNSARTAA